MSRQILRINLLLRAVFFSLLYKSLEKLGTIIEVNWYREGVIVVFGRIIGIAARKNKTP